MNQAVTFKCPSCGAYLEFDPEKQAFNCPFCESTFDRDALRLMSELKEEKQEQQAIRQDQLRTYHCHTCGAEIVTGDTTAATYCYYCHSPVVLSDRLSEEFCPDGVLPFTISREQAEEKFEQYIRSKKFVDSRFFTRDQREKITGVYYPYWYGDFRGEGSFEGEGARISTATTSREIITTTRTYHVHREGHVSFRNMVRQALSANDRKLSDGIHPYDLSKLQPFAMGYLSGFLAEKRDVECAAAQKDMEEEVRRAGSDMIRNSGARFDRLSGDSRFSVTDADMRYCLLPTWVLTYRGDKPGKTFYFMMNGQTGATCGRLPVSRSKLLRAGLIAGAVVCALLCAGGAFIW